MWGQIEPRLHELAKRAGMRDMPSGVMAAVLVLAALAVVWAAWRWWPSDAAAVGAESPPASTPTTVVQGEDGSSEEPPDSDAPVSSAPAVDTSVVVHVAGEVRHPGVYDVHAGARVIDAIESAGGLLGDAAADSVNLARPVTDGEQIVIPSKDEVASGAAPAAPAAAPAAGAGSASGTSASAGGGAAVNINTADAAALDQLPGVGPSTAQKIIAERETGGPFASPEDLGRVSGIGPKRLEQLKDLVCVR